MARETQIATMGFPLGGVNVVAPRSAQPEGTCFDCLNVRPFDVSEARSRGGARPGISKFVSSTIGGTTRVQDINSTTTVINSAPASSSLRVRQVLAVAVRGGTVYQVDSSSVSAATTSGVRTLSSTAPFIFSAELFGRVYYTDGTSYKIWVAANNTTTDWTPTAGSLPGTDGTTTPRLIEMWRSRLVLSGLRSDPHNWFMSKLGDPLDWDYAPATVTETQAIQGGSGVVGKIGDVITCMIPYSDEILIVGCDHSIYQIAGDPQASSGRIDLISDTIGMAFGRPWCRDSAGNVYFFSSLGHVYVIPGGTGRPQPLTNNSIAPLLIDTNLNTVLVRMVWDEVQQGLYLFITPFVYI